MSTRITLTACGKTSIDWLYGFKLHLVAGERGELLGVQLTASNVDDRAPAGELSKDLYGKLFGDRGYISQALHDDLFSESSVDLITKLRCDTKNCLMRLFDKLTLRKGAHRNY